MFSCTDANFKAAIASPCKDNQITYDAKRSPAAFCKLPFNMYLDLLGAPYIVVNNRFFI